MNLIFSNKVTLPFTEKVRYFSDKLGIDPNWLMWVMYFESSLNPHAINSGTQATGLIQFMPSTLLQWGITTADLLQMTAVEQLDYVYKYLKPYAGRMNSMIDVYFAVFFPAAMNKPDEWVMQTTRLSASKIAAQNAGLDINKDGQITRAEVIMRVSGGVPFEYQAIMKKKRAA